VNKIEASAGSRLDRGVGGALACFAELTERFIDWMGRVTAWLSLALVLIVAYDVLGRYVLGGASVAMQELEWYLIPPFALIGMSYTMRHGAHVRVDFLYNALPPRGRTFIDLFAAMLTVVISVIIVDLSINYVLQSFLMREGSPDPGGLPGRYVLKAFIPFGFGLLFIQAVAMCIKHGLKLVRGPRSG
jgi:TRAP-type mannitol/chloroaromatic compound transport system permease small subunit